MFLILNYFVLDAERGDSRGQIKTVIKENPRTIFSYFEVLALINE